ncbi:hypothetical protein [Anoxybacterium hadale]|uniref:hypothetical protein n=1 Tax=Anoxybacterium hadale TaxID=3408580 RepID=UPI003B00A8B8
MLSNHAPHPKQRTVSTFVGKDSRKSNSANRPATAAEAIRAHCAIICRVPIPVSTASMRRYSAKYGIAVQSPLINATNTDRYR